MAGTALHGWQGDPGLCAAASGLCPGIRAFLGGDIGKGLYISHLAYDIERNCDAKKVAPDDLTRLRKLAHDPAFPDMEMAITFALYRTRKS